ncbi:winged helix DNA-binding protein [Sphingomonas sp. PL-96]|uniref:MarR family winged helix-turn-helix transcriptional regulator n=1 Tax=Sphingomonas sp. PL-96 TaxID=2887201 RepID=UPI001E56F8A4|nr:MarR family transcriptional regulator [Sphingomonas sp. PL-96]MCC2976582.1 winged helix DNA-binding protein [Sphingomonas sp. PL-96]
MTSQQYVPVSEQDEWSTALTWMVLPAGRAWQRAAGVALARLGVSLSAAALILVVSRLGEGVRQKDVAEESAIDAAAIARSVTQLERDGLLQRRTDATDARARTLHLTAQGHALAERLEEALAQLRRDVLGGVSEQDGACAVRVLAALETACLAIVAGQE